jgi:hypothetical protein
LKIVSGGKHHTKRLNEARWGVFFQRGLVFVSMKEIQLTSILRNNSSVFMCARMYYWQQKKLLPETTKYLVST